MIRLDSTRKLQALLGGAVSTVALDAVVCFEDESKRDERRLPDVVKVSTVNSTVAVDICDAPDAAITRKVDYIAIRNADTATATVTVRLYDADATTKNIVSVSLATLNSLFYTKGKWHVMDSEGRVRS